MVFKVYITQLRPLLAWKQQTSTGYYEGPSLAPMSIDLDKWTYVSVIDTEYGHHVSKPNGLFLTSALAHYGGKNHKVM